MTCSGYWGVSNLMGCSCVKCGLLQGGYGDHLFDARDTFYCVSRICLRHVTCIFLNTYPTFQRSTYNLIEITTERRYVAFQCCENWQETGLWFWALLGTHICDAQFIIASYNWAVCEHYGIQKFVKFSTLVSDKLRLKNMMILFLWENLQHFVKQIVQKIYIFNILYALLWDR